MGWIGSPCGFMICVFDHYWAIRGFADSVMSPGNQGDGGETVDLDTRDKELQLTRCRMRYLRLLTLNAWRCNRAKSLYCSIGGSYIIGWKLNFNCRNPSHLWCGVVWCEIEKSAPLRRCNDLAVSSAASKSRRSPFPFQKLEPGKWWVFSFSMHGSLVQNRNLAARHVRKKFTFNQSFDIWMTPQRRGQRLVPFKSSVSIYPYQSFDLKFFFIAESISRTF